MSDEIFNEMFQNSDENNDGSLSLHEFKKVLYQRIVYAAIDEDASGTLGPTEIREAFACFFKIAMTDEEFDDAYSKMDKDSDGSVSFKEFKKYFNKILNDSSKSNKKHSDEEKM
jgi:Ca2+-binding EF-hand superfamily protein